MGKIIDLIKKYLPPYISIPLILHIAVFSGMLKIWPQEMLVISDLQTMSGKIPISTLLFTAISLYLILLASYVYLCFRIRKNLKPHFGVLWDKNKEPYCPIHKKPLARYKVKLESVETGVKCTECNENYQLMTDAGKRISLVKAKELL